MNVVRTREDLRKFLADWRRKNPGKRMSLVPTMGYLHDGHLSLVGRAKSVSDFTSLSIFVNPLQFNDASDYEKYPVNTDRDLELCAAAGVDLVFPPAPVEMFPGKKSPALVMSMPDLTKTLCGPFRPGHFEGVMLIVSRFLNLFQPDAAVFGAKDFQQLAIIRRLVRDLDFPVEIIAAPTIREKDGLAMSSRNVRLDEQGREHAGLIPRALKMGLKATADSRNSPGDVEEIVKDIIESGTKNRVEYVQLVDPETLERISELTPGRRFLLAVAAYTNNVRLIDNMEGTVPDQ